jgi:hypothetical protein
VSILGSFERDRAALPDGPDPRQHQIGGAQVARDLGADMVADGHAWAFVRYSRDYVEEEREAAAVRAGIHGHACEPAWQWRSERRKN